MPAPTAWSGARTTSPTTSNRACSTGCSGQPGSCQKRACESWSRSGLGRGSGRCCTSPTRRRCSRCWRWVACFSLGVCVCGGGEGGWEEGWGSCVAAPSHSAHPFAELSRMHTLTARRSPPTHNQVWHCHVIVRPKQQRAAEAKEAVAEAQAAAGEAEAGAEPQQQAESYWYWTHPGAPISACRAAAALVCDAPVWSTHPWTKPIWLRDFPAISFGDPHFCWSWYWAYVSQPWSRLEPPITSSPEKRNLQKLLVHSIPFYALLRFALAPTVERVMPKCNHLRVHPPPLSPFNRPSTARP